MSLEIESVPILSLSEDPANVRLHGEKNLESIKASLLAFGQQTPIVVSREGVVIAGNGRLRVMRELGWTHVDVVRSSLTPAEATRFAIADNRTAELAEWDKDGLGKILKALGDEGKLDGTGFSSDDIAGMFGRDVVQAAVPAPGDAAVSRTGDLWILGDHRLLVGDSSLRVDLERVLGGQRIQLVNTDPPYNVKVEPRSNNAIAAGLSSFTTTHHQKLDVERHPSKAAGTTEKMRPKDRPLDNDFLSDEEFDRLLRAWFGNLSYALEPGCPFYIWGGYGNLGNYPPAIAESGLYFSQGIVWNKLHPVLTRKDFMGAYELAFYGWKEGAAHRFYGPNNASDLWDIKKLTHTAMVHLTEKPVELAVRAIDYSSKRGDNVLDLFGGSGSTIMACEQTGRRGFSIEIDHLYADVIVQRWQALTNRKAMLGGGLNDEGKPVDLVHVSFDDARAARLAEGATPESAQQPDPA